MAEPRLLLKQSNGLLIYDENYPAPINVPDNYKISKNSPYVLEPILQECEYRTSKETYIAKCGCRHSKMYCTHFNKVVNVLTCMACKVNPNNGHPVTEGS